jgi:endonuclease YncB( thermonuclease family)
LVKRDDQVGVLSRQIKGESFLHWLILSLSSSAMVLSAHAVASQTSVEPSATVTIQGPARVLDGDTLEIGPVLVRLDGIDAPEVAQTCEQKGGGNWHCGKAASEYLVELTEHQQVVCEALERDPYGRIISRCTVNGTNLAGEMIDAGLAWAFVEYSDSYLSRQAVVAADAIGIWQATTQTPWDYRADKWARAVAASPEGCPIKGNIGRSHEKIYHTPWSPNYARTKINEAKGERWFCDEATALAAGWRPSRSR